jgi:hypothetical protein
MGFVFLLFLSLCLLFRYVFISTVESPTLVDFCEFLSVFFFFSLGAEISGKVGVNYGQLGNNLLSSSRSVELIKSLNVKQ